MYQTFLKDLTLGSSGFCTTVFHHEWWAVMYGTHRLLLTCDTMINWDLMWHNHIVVTFRHVFTGRYHTKPVIQTMCSGERGLQLWSLTTLTSAYLVGWRKGYSFWTQSPTERHFGFVCYDRMTPALLCIQDISVRIAGSTQFTVNEVYSGFLQFLCHDRFL
jgi:hypothetical protein